MGTQGPIEPKFLKEMRDVGVVTDFNRRLLVSQDWFYSQLYRDMLRAFYTKAGEQVPESILSRFSLHD